MVAKVSFVSLDASNRDSNGVPMAKIGDRVQVTVRIEGRQKSKGGSFKFVHPALDTASFPFQGLYDTGDKKRAFQKRKDRPTNYEGNDEFVFSVRVTGSGGPAAVTLLAETQCAVDNANSTTQFRGVADQTAIDLEMPAQLVDARTQRFAMSRAGNSGPASTAINRLQNQVRIWVKLCFLDPDDVERPFPEKLPVRALIGDRNGLRVDLELNAAGVATVSALGAADALKHRHLSLLLGDESDNVIRCELPTQTAAQSWGAVPAESDPTGTRPNRFFSLPTRLDLKRVECTVTGDDGRWDAATGRIALAKNGAPANLGTYMAPVKIVLKPKWQHLRFEFFDRHYGHSDHGGDPVVMPAAILEGFRSTPTSPTDAPEVKAYWWVDPASNGKVVQCVPWFRQKADDGSAEAHPDADSELRFALPANTFVHSESATVRKRVIATDEQRKPGPERLKFYDLPRLWKARNYYAALSATDGEHHWYQDMAAKDTTIAKPLVFNLDDIVLTDKDCKMLGSWNNSHGMALFVNTFDDSLGDCTREGLYKPDTGNKAPWLTEKPATGSPESNWNYVRARAKWARLIAAGGNLFDVFEARSVEGSTFGVDETVGARAARRLVDATAALPPMTTKQQSTTNPNTWNLVTDGPRPGRWVDNGPPARVDAPSFSVQPYYDQHYMKRFGVYSDASSGPIGRLDLALLRCCGVADRSTVGSEKEIAVHFYYVKTFLSFDPTLSGGADAFRVNYQRNVLDRWNGISPAHGRATLLPKDTAKRVQVPVVTFVQMTDEAVAHERVEIKAGNDARDWRQGLLGTGATGDGNERDSGDTNGFVTAHEHGHERALPDEYNERWDAASYGQPSFFSTLPGDPFEMDGRVEEFQVLNSPMMNGNHWLHNRYFWQSAEWTRRVLNFPFKVKFNGCDEYEVPPHANPRRHYAFWPLVGLNSQTLAAVAPLTGNRAKFHAFLYALGKDRFATQTLKDKEGGGATDYDGLLMVTPLLKVTPPSGDTASIKSLAQALARVARKFGARKLNHKFYLTGKVADGQPHEWTFTRCLIHFSPRLLIGSPDLPTREQFLAKVAPHGSYPQCDTFANQLATYHGVPWTPLATKQTALQAVRNAISDPWVAIDGDWTVASAAILPPPPPPPSTSAPPPPPPPPPPPRPAEFATIDTQLGLLPGTDMNSIGNRYAAVEAIIAACDSFISANGGSPYLPAAQAMKTRAEAGKRNTLAAWEMHLVKQLSNTLQTDRTKHDGVVTKVELSHTAHFELTCTRGAAASPKWLTTPPVVELPKKDDWVAGLDPSIRAEARVTTAGGNLDAYHNKPHGDWLGRHAALETLKNPAAAGTLKAERGDWDTASQVSGKTRPSPFSGVDTRLSQAASLADDRYDERVLKYTEAAQLLSTVIGETAQAPFHAAAQGLTTRLEAAVKENRVMGAARKLEKLATDRIAALQREVVSTKVTLTADGADAFEDALLEVFPSMVGVYKQASEITADDLKPIAALLGLTDMDVKAI